MLNNVCYPVPDEVYALWRTPVKDLPPACWMYFSRLLNRWLTCHGTAEAAWRFVRGDVVVLIDETPQCMDNGMSLWLGLLTTNLVSTPCVTPT